jgi:hypothetical protein
VIGAPKIYELFIRRGAGLLLVGLLALAGCTLSRDDPAPNAPAPTGAAPARSDAIGPDVFPANVNPLTGLAVDDPAVLQRRPLAIKISNAPDTVRPQAGIAAADLVFEHYVEARLTRFTAIYWTHTPPRIGSVRSARLIDLELPAMYGALFAYSGASEPIRQRIAALPFAPRAYEGVSVGEPLFFRDPALEPPHNLFVVPAEVWRRAAQSHQNQPPTLTGMTFSPTPLTEGYITHRVTISYGPDVVRWGYDERTGRYTRTSDGQPHRDANTGEPVTAANVVILFAHHQEDLSIVESEWQGRKDYSIEIQLWTLGPAVLLRDGQRLDGWWMRWEEDDLLSLWADEAGTQRLYLKPGTTWFQVVPLEFDGLRYN